MYQDNGSSLGVDKPGPLSLGVRVSTLTANKRWKYQHQRRPRHRRFRCGRLTGAVRSTSLPHP
jgi:hypothetical protein